ncbi:hypothetical protein WJX73_002621 [Symbiochloris irregularis]|uniref:Uncharacterized protein n=1 Tax=Symbiochloris irregularis TaxID=706552 RepID=A0AAW1P814_9CHLO
MATSHTPRSTLGAKLSLARDTHLLLELPRFRGPSLPPGNTNMQPGHSPYSQSSAYGQNTGYNPRPQSGPYTQQGNPGLDAYNPHPQGQYGGQQPYPQQNTGYGSGAPQNQYGGGQSQFPPPNQGPHYSGSTL